MKIVNPQFNATSFTCPHCGTLSEQVWCHEIKCPYTITMPGQPPSGGAFSPANTQIALCRVCKKVSLWNGNYNMVYPTIIGMEVANEDMPEDIKKDFDEARTIVNQSPRGASALLRLVIQKMCKVLGERGDNLNTDIGNLVKNKGLSATIQQALDSVRVTGNNAVHPGTIDLNDNPDVANALFGFVNVICDVLISQPKKIKDFYDKLPDGAKKGIETRDSLNSTQ